MVVPKTFWARARKPGNREPNGRLSRDNGGPATHSAVYVLKAGAAVKIGVSNNPRNRVSGIQNGQPVPVLLASQPMWLKTQDAYRVERMIHRALRHSKYHAHGEWYYLDGEAAAGIVLRAIERCGFTAHNEADLLEQEAI